MRVALVVWLALVSSVARADGGISVIVSGTMGVDVHEFVERWLRSHGYHLAAESMPAEAMTAFANCLVIDDQTCARGVATARSSASTIVYARVDTTDKEAHDLAFTMYWFPRGRVAIQQHRACPHCTETDWHDAIDDVLGALVRASGTPTGHLKLDSSPRGLEALLDGEPIGTTPVERDVAAGSHRVSAVHDGHRSSRKIAITPDDTTEVTVDANVEDVVERPSRVLPVSLLGTGIAALITGSIFLYYGSLTGSNQKYVYTESTPVGVGFLVVGIGATLGGSVLLWQSTRSGPVASLTPGGGYVGWLTRF
jgi:PEGA domain